MVPAGSLPDFCLLSPPFRTSIEPYFFSSVLRPLNVIGTLCAQLLLQFYVDSFETSLMFRCACGLDIDVVWI